MLTRSLKAFSLRTLRYYSILVLFLRSRAQKQNNNEEKIPLDQQNPFYDRRIGLR